METPSSWIEGWRHTYYACHVLTLLQKAKRQCFNYTVHRGAVIYGACMEPGYGTDEARLPTTDKILMMLGRASRSYPASDRQVW